MQHAAASQVFFLHAFSIKSYFFHVKKAKDEENTLRCPYEIRYFPALRTSARPAYLSYLPQGVSRDFFFHFVFFF